MSHVLAVANQKGGVAKTTTVHALAAAMVEQGRTVLCIDLDPQASLSFAMGVADEPDSSMYNVLVERRPITEVLYESNGIDVAPAAIELAGAESRLLTRTGREFVLARALKTLRDEYDVVLLDCPPSLGTITINALTAADEVLIPLQAELLTLRGLAQLLATIDEVRMVTNPDLIVRGAIITMYDSRTRLGREVIAALRNEHEIELLEPFVPKSVRVAEAPGRGLSVLGHAGRNPAAEAYRALAAQLA